MEVSVQQTEPLAVFVACVFSPEDIIEVRRLPSGRSSWHAAGDLPRQLPGLLSDNARGQNLYVGVNARARRGGTTATDVLRAHCLFADFDNTTIEHAQESWQAVGLPEPTLLANSGHGVHAYWRLIEPITDLAAWSLLQTSMATALGSDPAVHDAPRIMRLPGFKNLKPPVALCHIISADPARTYNLADVQQCLPQAATKTAVVPAPAGALNPGERHGAMLKIAGAMRRQNASENEIYAALVAVNERCSPPKPDEELRQIARDIGKKQQGPDSVPDAPAVFGRTLAEIMAEPEYGRGSPPITSGFACFDDALRGGFRPSCTYVIAGRTGSAKSTLIANIARRVALNGVRTLIHKLEESPVELARRIHAASAQVDLRVLMDGTAEAGEGELFRLAEAAKVLAGTPLWISGRRELGQIIGVTERHVNKGIDLVLIDQLSHVQIPDMEVGYRLATAVSNALRQLALDCNVPIVIVVQVNRAASKSTDPLSINDLRDSGAIENDSCAVFLIDKVNRPEGLTTGHTGFVLDILLGKNRYGSLRTDKPLNIAWYPRHCRMEDV